MKERKKKQGWNKGKRMVRAMSFLLICIIFVSTLVEAFATTKEPPGDILENLGIREDITYSEDFKSAEIKFDLSGVDSDSIKIERIIGMKESELDLKTPVVFVEENGEFNFVVEYIENHSLINEGVLRKTEIVVVVDGIAERTEEEKGEEPEDTGEAMVKEGLEEKQAEEVGLSEATVSENEEHNVTTEEDGLDEVRVGERKENSVVAEEDVELENDMDTTDAKTSQDVGKVFFVGEYQAGPYSLGTDPSQSAYVTAGHWAYCLGGDILAWEWSSDKSFVVRPRKAVEFTEPGIRISPPNWTKMVFSGWGGNINLAGIFEQNGWKVSDRFVEANSIAFDRPTIEPDFLLGEDIILDEVKTYYLYPTFTLKTVTPTQVRRTAYFDAFGGEFENGEKIFYKTYNKSLASITFAEADIPTPTKKGCKFLGWVVRRDWTMGNLIIKKDTDFIAWNFNENGHYVENGNCLAADSYLAVWSDSNESQVRYLANGGAIDGEISKIVGIKNGANYESGGIPIAKRDGYCFDGWYTSAGSGDKMNPKDIPTEDKTFYAHWTLEPDKYTLTYEPNKPSGVNNAITVPDSLMAYAGSSYTALGEPNPATFTANDKTFTYTFKEWNTKADGTGIAYAKGAVVPANGNITLYAVWTRSENAKYALTYNANKPSGVSSAVTVPGRLEAYVGSSFTALGAPNPLTLTSDNKAYTYTFKEWNTKADGTGIAYAKGAVVPANGNITLYAVWTRSENTKYALTYNANKPSGVSSAVTVPGRLEAYVGSSFTALGAPNPLTLTSDDKAYTYTFKEWNTKADGTGIAYAKGAVVPANSNVTLYVVWTRSESTKYTLIYNANKPNGISGTVKVPDSLTAYDGSSYGALGEPNPLTITSDDKASTYTFKEWNTKADGTGTPYKKGAVVPANGDVTLYAVWDLIKFKLEYYVSSSNDVTWWQNYTKPFYVIPAAQSGNLGERLMIQSPILINNPYKREKPFLISMKSYAAPNDLNMLEFTGWSSKPGSNTSLLTPEYTAAAVAAGEALFDTNGESGGITGNGKLYAWYKAITFSLSYDPNLPEGATQAGKVPVDIRDYQFATKPKVMGNPQELSAKKGTTTYELVGWNRTPLEPLETMADVNIDYKLEDCDGERAEYETKGTEEIYHMKDVDGRSTIKGGITSDGTLYAVWRAKKDDQISFEQEIIKLSNISEKVSVKNLPKLIINGEDATSEQMADLTYKYERYERSGKSGAYTYGWSIALTEGTDDDAIALLPIIVNKPEGDGTIISASTIDNLSGIVRLTVTYNGQEASCIIIVPGDINLDKRVSAGDLEKLESYVYGEAEPEDYEYQILMSVLRNDSVLQNTFPSMRDLEYLEKIIFS